MPNKVKYDFIFIHKAPYVSFNLISKPLTHFLNISLCISFITPCEQIACIGKLSFDSLMYDTHIIGAALEAMTQHNKHLLFCVLKLRESHSFLCKELLLMRLKVIRFLCCVWLWLFRGVVSIICSGSCRFGVIFLWISIFIIIVLKRFLLLFELFHPHRLGDFVKYELM